MTASLLSKKVLQTEYPCCWEYLSRNRNFLESREKGKFKDEKWYRFGRTQNIGLWDTPKILAPYMVRNLSVYFDETENFCFVNVTTGGYGILCNQGMDYYFYLCGLLNSRLLNFYFKRITTTFHGGYFAANKQFIGKLPIKKIDISNQKEINSFQEIVTYANRITQVYKKDLQTPNENESRYREIELTSQMIDRLVYELYGLTEEEIKIVEGGVKAPLPCPPQIQGIWGGSRSVHPRRGWLKAGRGNS